MFPLYFSAKSPIDNRALNYQPLDQRSGWLFFTSDAKLLAFRERECIDTGKMLSDRKLDTVNNFAAWFAHFMLDQSPPDVVHLDYGSDDHVVMAVTEFLKSIERGSVGNN